MSEIINSNEVKELGGFSYRTLQNYINGRTKSKTKLKYHEVENKQYFFQGKWCQVPQKYCRSNIVFRRKEFVKWYNDNFKRVIE